MGRRLRTTVKDSDTTNDTFDYMVKIPENLSYIDGVLAYLPCVCPKGNPDAESGGQTDDCGERRQAWWESAPCRF